MADDLVQRLRNTYWLQDMSKRAIAAEICAEAADEIESLRKQLAAFYRINTQGMNAVITSGRNVAQGQE